MPKTKESKNTMEKGLLLDVTYFDENNESIISLFVKGEKKHYWLKDKEFRPYLYVLAAKGEEEKYSQNEETRM